MPNYSGDWAGSNRWLVNYVDTSVSNLNMEVGDELTFLGDGIGPTVTDDEMQRKQPTPTPTVTTWGRECNHTSATDIVTLKNGSGAFRITREPGTTKPRTPAKLSCYKNGPTGAVWTALDQYP